MIVLDLVLEWCNILEYKEKVKEILNKCEITTYEALKKLKNEKFLQICADFCKEKSIEITPGIRVLLKKIGKKVASIISADEFHNVFSNMTIKTTVPDNQFPLLTKLNAQVNNRNYSNTLKDLSTLIRLKAGRDVHEILSENLPMPKVSSTDKYLNQLDTVVEGELQTKGLLRYLDESGCSQDERKVWIAEDATAIVKRIEYMSTTNQVVGFVPQLTPGTGMPVTGSFPFESLSVVKKYFDTCVKAKSVYAFMVIPLNTKASPYVLCIFSTDNRFDFVNVSSRFTFIKNKLAEINIDVLGYSSDADARLLKSMKQSCNLGDPCDDGVWNEIFFSKFENELVFFQDLYHILSKIRARALETSNPMKIGSYKVSLSTLKCLIKDNPTLKKYVKPSDFNSDDKMNVEAAKRLCQKEVINMIEDQGLKIFLSLLKDFYDAFEMPNLSIEERITKAWVFNFVLRAWRHSILEDVNRKMSEFISYPTYNCIELNCHNLIILYRKLRDDSSINVFNFLQKCSSQPCEELFRKFRSMTTINWTSINFSMLEVLYKTKRVDAIFQLEKSLAGEIKMPRVKKVNDDICDVEAVDDQTLFNMIIQARIKASQIVEEAGIKIAEGSFKYDKRDKSKNVKKEVAEDEDEDETFHDENSQNDSGCSINSDELQQTQQNNESEVEILDKYCRSFAQLCPADDERNDNRFCYVAVEDEYYKVRKETFVKILDEPEFLSKDRTKRFISKKKIETPKVFDGDDISTFDKLAISDWIIVKNFKGLARVLEFKDIYAKTIAKGRVRESIIDLNSERSSSLGMLLDYYIVKSDGHLQHANVTEINDSGFIPLHMYKTHVPTPIINGVDKFKCIDTQIFQKLSKFINVSPEKPFSKGFSSTKKVPKPKKKKRSQESDDEDYVDKRDTKKSVKAQILKRKHESDDDNDDELRALENIRKRRR